MAQKNIPDLSIDTPASTDLIEVYHSGDNGYLTVANFQAAFKQAMGYGAASLPYVRVDHSGDQSNEAVCVWDTETSDAYGFFNPAANDRFTVPSGYAGRYFVTANIFPASSSLQENYCLNIEVNGVIFYEMTNDNLGHNVAPGMTVQGILDLSDADYVRIWLRDYGLTEPGNSYSNHFSMCRLPEQF